MPPPYATGGEQVGDESDLYGWLMKKVSVETSRPSKSVAMARKKPDSH